MRGHAPFQPADLDELDRLLLAEAVAVAPMAGVFDGAAWPRVIGLRHDVDNRIEPAVQFARWEQERGYRATYFILHTAPYWQDKSLLQRSLEQIADAGHEIGIHNNALAAGYATGGDPAFLLGAAIEELREYGYEIRGTVAHGDSLCYDADGKVRFVNDELFTECPRPMLGAPNRTIDSLTISPQPLAAFGLDYDANWLRRGAYTSDSGGAWRPDFHETVMRFASGPEDQLHVLVHPDWWAEAFTEVLA